MNNGPFPQMELILKLSGINSTQDNEIFFEKEIKPCFEKIRKSGITNFNFRSLLGDTLVHICTFNRLPTILKFTFQFCTTYNLDFDLTLADSKVGQTPISIAASMGNVSLVRWFLNTVQNHDVLLKRTDESGKLPVYFAASFSSDLRIRDELIELLDPRKELRNIPDFQGVSAEQVIKKVGFVFEGTKDCSILRDCFGRTQFMINVFYSNLPALQEQLVTCKNDEERINLVNAKDYCGRTALIYACYMGKPEVVEILLPYANVNQTDNRGQSPLHFSVLFMYRVQKNSHLTQIIEVLLKKGALDLPNHYNYSPSDFASLLGSKPTMNIIRDHMDISTFFSELSELTTYFDKFCSDDVQNPSAITNALSSDKSEPEKKAYNNKPQ